MKRFICNSRRTMLLSAIALICMLLPGLDASGQVVVPPFDLLPLNQSAIPEPPNLYEFVTNKAAAIQLGKAFFWDMQVGSDGLTACASCHFHAGADNRMKNTVNPGTKAGDTTFQVVGPNGTLQMSDFPFHMRAKPAEAQSDPIIRDSNDVVGSQGVRRFDFIDVIPGSAVDDMIQVFDPIFNVNGTNVRQVTGRHAPTVINSIFNLYNFWDGRAHYIFNGENPFGPADPYAGIWFNEPGEGLVKKPLRLTFGSLASLATGPALDSVEMSARGRTFPQLGKKMLSLVPLGKQLVSHDDSQLGGLARSAFLPGAPGLHTSYDQLIMESFHSHLWDSGQLITINLPNGQPSQFTQMEANFSFFWGVAIQMYLATQVSDQTPFDHWLGGDQTAMTDQQKQGFALFSGIAKCTLCHGGIELTNASVANSGFINNDVHFLIDLMFVADGTQVIYDTGFNNTAVTRTTDDIARGGTSPFYNPLTGELFPLSVSTLSKLDANGLLPFQAPILPPGVPANMQVNADGAFKVSGLRNIELTAPFFHNGSIMDLDDMMDFLIRGGNYPIDNIHDLDPDIGTGIPFMRGNEPMEHAIIEFMKSLTDPRVVAESAPFDHPELLIPEGDPEVLRRIPARDSNGNAVLPDVLTINAFMSPITSTSMVLSGIVEAGLTPLVAVNAPVTAAPVMVNGIEWSVLISDLIDGDNVVMVSVIDNSGVETILTETITVVLNAPPSITSTPVTEATTGQLYVYYTEATDPTGDALTYSLTAAPSGMFVIADLGVVIWMPSVAQAGQHNVTVRAADPGGLSASQSFTVMVQPATYAISGRVTGSPPIAGVTITLIGPASGTAVTDASGNYSFTGLSAGSYEMVPSLNGYRFSPISREVNITGYDASGRNFKGMRTSFAISGALTDRTGAPLGGVSVYLSGPVNKTAVTDASGNYSFPGLTGGNYEVMPFLNGTRFSPLSRDVKIRNSDVAGRSFRGINRGR